MTSGLAWNEWGAAHATAANDIDMLYLGCEDPLSCVLRYRITLDDKSSLHLFIAIE